VRARAFARAAAVLVPPAHSARRSERSMGQGRRAVRARLGLHGSRTLLRCARASPARRQQGAAARAAAHAARRQRALGRAIARDVGRADIERFRQGVSMNVARRWWMQLRRHLSPLAGDTASMLDLPPVRMGLLTKLNLLTIGLIFLTAVAITA